jgi:hypothetical protein
MGKLFMIVKTAPNDVASDAECRECIFEILFVQQSHTGAQRARINCAFSAKLRRFHKGLGEHHRIADMAAFSC